jgi:hypothetical protein
LHIDDPCLRVRTYVCTWVCTCWRLFYSNRNGVRYLTASFVLGCEGCSQVVNFIPSTWNVCEQIGFTSGYDFSHTGMRLLNQVWNFWPGYVTEKLIGKFLPLAKTSVPMLKLLHLEFDVWAPPPSFFDDEMLQEIGVYGFNQVIIHICTSSPQVTSNQCKKVAATPLIVSLYFYLHIE